MKPERVEGEPVDQLGRLADSLLRELKKRSELMETGPVRCVVFLENDERCMTALNENWGSDTEAVAAVFAHLAAVFKANGKKLVLLPMKKVGHD